MKHFILTFLFSATLLAQPNTEVFLFDMEISENGINFSNKQNVSNDEGYDNQPFFYTNDLVLFAGNNNGQTDIAEYNLNTNKKTWLNKKTEGGEYSPQVFFSNKDIAAVRLDKDGLQRLYKYNIENGKSSMLIEKLQVAYFAFYTDKKVLATVLDGDAMDLVLIDLQSKSADTLFRKAGRSLQKVPKTNFMSYSLVNDEGNLDLYLLDMNSYESYFVTELPIGIQDYLWINDTQILIGSDNKLYMYDTLGVSEWTRVASLEAYGLKNITRMAISPDGKKLAVVAEID